MMSDGGKPAATVGGTRPDADHGGPAPAPALPAVAVVDFRLRWRRDGRMSDFLGSAFRGAFGHALRALGCRRTPSCASGCAAPADCPVAHLFETPPLPPGVAPTRFRQPPHPLALRAPTGIGVEVRRDDVSVVGWSLLAPRWGDLPLIARCVEEMGRRGIGAERLPFEVVDARAWATPGRAHPWAPGEPPPAWQPRALPAGDLRLQLLTPLRLQSEGQPWREWDARAFVAALVRRSWLLAEFYGGERRRPPPTEALVCGSRDVQVQWVDRDRWSNRQARHVPWGGLLGDVVLTGVAPELAAALAWAEALQVGKGTTLGLGRVEVEPP